MESKLTWGNLTFSLNTGEKVKASSYVTAECPRLNSLWIMRAIISGRLQNIVRVGHTTTYTAHFKDELFHWLSQLFWNISDLRQSGRERERGGRVAVLQHTDSFSLGNLLCVLGTGKTARWWWPLTTLSPSLTQREYIILKAACSLESNYTRNKSDIFQSVKVCRSGAFVETVGIHWRDLFRQHLTGLLCKGYPRGKANQICY